MNAHKKLRRDIERKLDEAKRLGLTDVITEGHLRDLRSALKRMTLVQLAGWHTEINRHVNQGDKIVIRPERQQPQPTGNPKKRRDGER